jgi:hypothetical protein
MGVTSSAAGYAYSALQREHMSLWANEHVGQRGIPWPPLRSATHTRTPTSALSSCRYKHSSFGMGVELSHVASGAAEGDRERRMQCNQRKAYEESQQCSFSSADICINGGGPPHVHAVSH